MPRKQRSIEPIHAQFDDLLDCIIIAQRNNKEIIRMGLTWEKKLSKTDAQQETTGGIVPYLRLTKGSLAKNLDFQTWFRNSFFDCQSWKKENVGREDDTETCNVTMNVTFSGVRFGDISFTISHGPNRWERNNAPNTWVHWPVVLQDALFRNDMTGKVVRITRDHNNILSMQLG